MDLVITVQAYYRALGYPSTKHSEAIDGHNVDHDVVYIPW